MLTKEEREAMRQWVAEYEPPVPVVDPDGEMIPEETRFVGMGIFCDLAQALTAEEGRSAQLEALLREARRHIAEHSADYSGWPIKRAREMRAQEDALLATIDAALGGDDG